MFVALDHEKIIYCGRIDDTNRKKPEFIFPASYMRFRFRGRKAELVVSNQKVCWDNSVGACIDGKCLKKWNLNNNGKTRITLIAEEMDAEHDILFYKRQDSCHVLVLELLELSDGSELLLPSPEPIRRIEVYGDSVSAGEVSEAVDYVGMTDPNDHNGRLSNSWYSYAWIAARKMNASIHDIAQGGIPLINGNGWVAPPVYPGMEFMWDKVHYHPQLGRVTNWNFTKYIPHVVILAIGQNDSNPDNYMKEDFDGLRAVYWRYKYKQLVENIREKYPKALILLSTTILEHDSSWDIAIDEVCREIDDARILHFFYSKNGCGTPGHIRIPEAEKMADELVEFIEQLEIPVWED